jgi:hypothetical protein
MNERIKLLADEAGIKRVDLHYTEEQPPYTIVSYRGSPDNTDPLTKFAELIVKECALTAGLMEHEGRKNIGSQILDNFGVEE